MSFSYAGNSLEQFWLLLKLYLWPSQCFFLWQWLCLNSSFLQKIKVFFFFISKYICNLQAFQISSVKHAATFLLEDATQQCGKNKVKKKNKQKPVHHACNGTFITDDACMLSRHFGLYEIYQQKCLKWLLLWMEWSQPLRASEGLALLGALFTFLHCTRLPPVK